MTNKKISNLTVATTPLAGTEVLPIVQSEATVKVTVADLTAGRTVSALNFTAPTFYASARAASPPTYGGNVYFDSDGGLNSGVGGVEWQYATSGAGYGFKINSNTANDSLEVGHRANSATWVVDWRFANTGNLIQNTAAKGVNFTANTPAAGMTSQLLNWYEEGTFTATLTAATVPTTPPTTTARYTRVGRQVTVSMTFDAANTSGASGAMKITGLPFTPASTAVSTYLSFQFALGGYPIAVIFSGSTDIFFYYTASNADWATQSITAGAGKYLYLSLTYTV